MGQPNTTTAGQAAWACGNSTASGRNCSAPCRNGYSPGSVTATCSEGKWGSIQGICTVLVTGKRAQTAQHGMVQRQAQQGNTRVHLRGADVLCCWPARSAECAPLPKIDLIPEATWNCPKTAHSGTCTATCTNSTAATSSGAPVLQCDAGDWRYLRGSCGGTDMYFLTIIGPSEAVALWRRL